MELGNRYRHPVLETQEKAPHGSSRLAADEADLVEFLNVKREWRWWTKAFRTGKVKPFRSEIVDSPRS